MSEKIGKQQMGLWDLLEEMQQLKAIDYRERQEN